MTYFVLLKRVKSGMLIAVDSHELVTALKVDNQSQVLVVPDTKAGCAKTSRTLPALRQIQSTIPTDTGTMRTALMRNSDLPDGNGLSAAAKLVQVRNGKIP